MRLDDLSPEAYKMTTEFTDLIVREYGSRNSGGRLSTPDKKKELVETWLRAWVPAACSGGRWSGVTLFGYGEVSQVSGKVGDVLPSHSVWMRHACAVVPYYCILIRCHCTIFG